MAATSFHKATQLGFVGCPKANGGAFCDASQHSGLRLKPFTQLSAGVLKWDLVRQSLQKGMLNCARCALVLYLVLKNGSALFEQV
jgi:hypothetical protein